MNFRIYEDYGKWILWNRDTDDKTIFDTEIEAQEAARMSAIQKWQEMVFNAVPTSNDLVIQVDAANMMYAVNGLETLIANTAAGEIVGDSTLRKEAAQVYALLVASFLTWANTDVVGANLTPHEILSLQ